MGHPVRAAGGSVTHSRAFDRIASGAYPRCSGATLSWLERNGFVVRHVALGRRPSFSVSTKAQRAWCDWCSGADERRRKMTLVREKRTT